MNKEKIAELVEEIDLWKRVLEGAITTIKVATDRIDSSLDQLNEIINEED